jgi:hypothetical protein
LKGSMAPWVVHAAALPVAVVVPYTTVNSGLVIQTPWLDRDFSCPCCARVAVCGWLWRQNAAGSSSASARTSAKLGTSLVGLMKDPNADVRRSAVKAVKRFAKQCPGMGGRVVEVRACRQCIVSFHISFHTQGHQWPPRPVPCLCPCVLLWVLVSTLAMLVVVPVPPTVCSPTGVGCPRQQRARQARVRARPHARAAGPHQPRCPGGEWVAGPC